MLIVKYSFANYRDRIVQFFIFGLIFLSFFMYHYATTNEIYQLTVSTTRRQSPAHVSRLILNTSEKVQGPSSVMDTTLKPETQSLSFSTIAIKGGDESVIEQLVETLNIEENNANTFAKGLTQAIYRGGHSVRIPEKCPVFGVELKLLILITSAPNNELARTGIRQTWGHYDQRKDISIAFILGDTTDSKIEAALLLEQEMYGDIIRGNFVDSYKNLTLKTISALEWVCDYCSEVKWVLKTDDDMFINVPRLLTFIEQRSTERSVIYGRLARNWKPFRNNNSKYYLSESDYKPNVFPLFTTGPAYLLSSDIIPKLFESSLHQTYLKLEDVFLTGIVAEKLGIKRRQAKGFLNEKIPFTACNIQRSISIHMVKYTNQFDLWKKLLGGQSKCK